jgi:3'-5' exonuclease
MAIKLESGEAIVDRHYLVRKAEKKNTRSGDLYMELELSDKDGVIGAKIWNNSLPFCHFEVGKVAEVNGKSQEYNGNLSLIIEKCQTVESEEAEDYFPIIPTMVFDIETVGKKFDELDSREQDYLLNNLCKDIDDKEDAKKRTALFSIFGMVCAIGCINPETNKGLVLTIADKELVPEKDNYTYKVFKNEKELLEEFWQVAKKYEIFVTYNGDSFDFPYLIIRSGINRVKVSLTKNKYDNEKFIDLQNKIRQNHGFKLEFLCKAFGIENPKESGVHGDDVSFLFYNKEYNSIANYVARDTFSTAQLYKIWKDFMSGQI